jgi:hypothetical protein
MAVSTGQRYVIDITAVPRHITGLSALVTGFYGMFGYIFTVCKILWHLVCDRLNLRKRFLIPIRIQNSWCSHTVTIRHNYVLYQSDHVINQDICYFFGVEFVQLNIYTQLDSSTTPAIALATPRKSTL